MYSSYPTDRIKTMFGSSLPLPPVVCRRVHVLFVLFMFVCLCIVVSNTHCVLFCFLCFCALSVSLECAFLIDCPFDILKRLLTIGSYHKYDLINNHGKITGF